MERSSQSTSSVEKRQKLINKALARISWKRESYKCSQDKDANELFVLNFLACRREAGMLSPFRSWPNSSKLPQHSFNYIFWIIPSRGHEKVWDSWGLYMLNFLFSTFFFCSRQFQIPFPIFFSLCAKTKALCTLLLWKQDREKQFMYFKSCQPICCGFW